MGVGGRTAHTQSPLRFEGTRDIEQFAWPLLAREMHYLPMSFEGTTTCFPLSTNTGSRLHIRCTYRAAHAHAHEDNKARQHIGRMATASIAHRIRADGSPVEEGRVCLQRDAQDVSKEVAHIGLPAAHSVIARVQVYMSPPQRLVHLGICVGCVGRTKGHKL